MSQGLKLLEPKNCKECGVELPLLRHIRQVFCTNKCYQLDRYRKIFIKNNAVKCLECNKSFTRVGSHVVQSHNYETAREYREYYGLSVKETRTEEYANRMRAKASTYDNLKLGINNRFVKNGKHIEILKKWWKNRKNNQKMIKN